MPRKEKKYHYIYKTTNVINNKYYIGMHSTNNLNDGYMGSGKRLWFSINYHGKDNHKLEILEFCENRKELSNKEREIVNDQLLSEHLCMNLIVGGQGGDGGLFNEEHKKAFIEAGKQNLIKTKEKREISLLKIRSTSEYKIKMSNTQKERFKNCDGTFKGKLHNHESKLKISKSMKGKGSGIANTQFGKCWITNESENKKIKRGDLLPEGFRLGRVLK